jgi:hypothetical protein
MRRKLSNAIFLLSGFFFFTSCEKNESSIEEPKDIGQNYGGGIVFYVDNNGQHGLIAAPSNQGSPIISGWGSVVEARNTAIGTGQINTEAIVSELGNTYGNYAAKVCYDLELDGYTDWFLPSKDELQLLYENKTIVGMGNGIYWSSSEVNSIWVWLGNFQTGELFYCEKNSTAAIRPIRAF